MLSPGFAAQLSTCTPVTPLDSLWCIDIDTKPGACITHNATQPLSDITGGNWLDYMEQQRVFLTYAVVLPNWCKIGGVAPLIRTQTGPDPRRTKWILCLFIHLECSFTRNPIRIKKKNKSSSIYSSFGSMIRCNSLNLAAVRKNVIYWENTSRLTLLHNRIFFFKKQYQM